MLSWLAKPKLNMPRSARTNECMRLDAHGQAMQPEPEEVRAIALSTRTFIMWCAGLQALRMLRHKRAQIEVKVKHQQILMLGQLVRYLVFLCKRKVLYLSNPSGGA